MTELADHGAHSLRQQRAKLLQKVRGETLIFGIFVLGGLLLLALGAFGVGDGVASAVLGALLLGIASAQCFAIRQAVLDIRLFDLTRDGDSRSDRT